MRFVVSQVGSRRRAKEVSAGFYVKIDLRMIISKSQRARSQTAGKTRLDINKTRLGKYLCKADIHYRSATQAKRNSE